MDDDGTSQTYDQEAALIPGAFNQPAAPPGLPEWMQHAAEPPPSLSDHPGSDQGGSSGGSSNLLTDPVLQSLQHAGEGIMAGERANTAKMVGTMDEGARDMASVPTPQLGKAPEAPKAQFGQGMMEYVQFASVLAALAGGLARRNTTVALTAFAGAVKGFTEGKEQDFKSKLEEWRAASETVKADNQAKLDQYDLIMKNKKMSMDMKLASMKLVATQYSDELTYNLAQQKQYEQLAMLNEREKQMQINNDRSQKKMDIQAANFEMKIEDRNKQQQANMDGEADRYIDGLPGAGSGFARSPQLKTQWLETLQRRMQERQVSDKDIIRNRQEYAGGTREQSAIGQRAGQLAIISNEAANIIPAVDKASKASPRRGVAAWNAVTNEWKVQTGDPAFATLVTQTNSLISLYGAVLARGGQGTQEQRDHAREMLNPNQPPAAFEASLRAIAFDVNVARQAPNNVREENRSGVVAPIELPAQGNGTKPTDGWGQMQTQ